MSPDIKPWRLKKLRALNRKWSVLFAVCRLGGWAPGPDSTEATSWDVDEEIGKAELAAWEALSDALGLAAGLDDAGLADKAVLARELGFDMWVDVLNACSNGKVY